MLLAELAQKPHQRLPMHLAPPNWSFLAALLPAFAKRPRPQHGPIASHLLLACLLVVAVLAGTVRPLALWAEEPLPDFPPELTQFVPYEGNPLFTGAGPGNWDEKIRERGWIIKEEGQYRMWYTGYSSARPDLMMLGYATSTDGLEWTRYEGNPLYDQHWVEDMMVVRHEGTYFMFAEGARDRAHLLTSPDGIHWSRVGQLDVRCSSGEPLSDGPYGTPTAWIEDGTCYLFYERRDQGVWLARSRDMRVWTNVQDEPVLSPGPDAYDGELIALNQVLKYAGRYYAWYHGSGSKPAEGARQWTTNLAVSHDLRHWKKYPGNPVLQQNQSSGIVVEESPGCFRLYAMHPEVRVHLAAERGPVKR
jgi:predicted GH43/DUF377 family glycosyl hydrolase